MLFFALKCVFGHQCPGKCHPMQLPGVGDGERVTAPQGRVGSVTASGVWLCWGAMDGRMDGWMDRQMDGRTNGWADGHRDGQTDGQTHGCTNRRMDRQTDRQNDGWTDRQHGHAAPTLRRRPPSRAPLPAAPPRAMLCPPCHPRHGRPAGAEGWDTPGARGHCRGGSRQHRGPAVGHHRCVWASVCRAEIAPPAAPPAWRGRDAPLEPRTWESRSAGQNAIGLYQPAQAGSRRG